MAIIRSLTRNDLDVVCDLINIDGDDARTNYSGRGMNGRTCIGFVVSPGEIAAVGAALVAVLARSADPDDVDDALDDGVELARRAVVDSMGRDAIVYFPGVTLAEASTTD